jgi:hypothetical protein
MTSWRELRPFPSDVRAKDCVAGDVTSGPSKTGYEPGPDWVANSDHNDRDFRRRLLGREGRMAANVVSVPIAVPVAIRPRLLKPEELDMSED